jgi:hypothetical protein
LQLANTGKVAGAEVVQVYVEPVNPSVTRPLKELKGFAKVFLKPGEKTNRSPSRSTKTHSPTTARTKKGWVRGKRRISDSRRQFLARHRVCRAIIACRKPSLNKIDSWQSGVKCPAIHFPDHLPRLQARQIFCAENSRRN